MVQTELPGLAAEVAKGHVAYASIFVGGNDFLDLLSSVSTGGISIADAPARLAQLEAQAEANVQTAVDRLLSANPSVRLLVATAPDVNELPIVKVAAAQFPTYRPLLADVSTAIQRYNASIETLAAGNSRIALVDLAKASAVLAQEPATVPFGGTNIDLSTPGDDYHHFFLADGIHVGTVGQGLIANEFITALDTSFGAHIKPLSANEIVRFAKSVQAATRRGGGPV
jgi:hypothetical protein